MEEEDGDADDACEELFASSIAAALATATSLAASASSSAFQVRSQKLKSMRESEERHREKNFEVCRYTCVSKWDEWT